MTDTIRMFSNYPSRPIGRPLPQIGVGTTGNVCVTFDKKWLPILRSLILALVVPGTWSGNKNDLAGSASILLDRFLNPLNEDCGGMNCDDISFAITEDGHLHFYCLDGDIDLGNVIGPQGPQGDPGKDGVYEPPEPGPINPTTEDLACAVSTWMQGYIHERWLDFMDATETIEDAGATIAKVLNELINLLLQFTFIGDEALSAATDLAVGALQFTVDALRAMDTADFQEYVRCCLYCQLIEHDGTLGENWDAVIGPWIGCVADSFTYFGVAQLYALFLTAISFSTYQREARVAAFETHSCEDCGDCGNTFMHTWKMSDGSLGEGWHILDDNNWNPSGIGHYTEGVGMESTAQRKESNHDDQTAVWFGLTLPSAITLTGVRVVFEYEDGLTGGSASDERVYISASSNNVILLDKRCDEEMPASPIKLDFEEVVDTSLNVFMLAGLRHGNGGVPWGFVKVSEVTVAGIGTDPF